MNEMRQVNYFAMWAYCWSCEISISVNIFNGAKLLSSSFSFQNSHSLPRRWRMRHMVKNQRMEKNLRKLMLSNHLVLLR